MSIEIRPPQPEDHDAIWAMLAPVFRAGDTYAIDRDIGRRAALEYWLGAHAFVADDGHALLGTFYIRPNQAGGGAHVCNCGYITAQDAQGRGVARAMLARSLHESKALGFEAMQFNFVLETNTRAIATWERAGFTIIGRQPRAFRHSDGRYADALTMHRFL